MPADDEAVQLAFKTGSVTIETTQALIQFVLEGVAQARRARAAGGKKESSAVKAARGIKHGVANKIDGHGEKGIVSAATVRAENPDQYKKTPVFAGSAAENRDDIKKLKRELKGRGVKFAVIDGIDPVTKLPTTSIGVQARDMDLMTQALIDVGAESFGMDRKELEASARGIDRDEQGRYPRAFKRNGINWEFERTGDGRNSWVGSAGNHSREQYRVTLDDKNENKASFECTRNGRSIATADVDATQGPDLWKTSSDGSREFYNEMKAGGAAFAAAPGMVLEAACDRGCFIAECKRDLDRAKSAAAEKNAALLGEVSGNSKAASPESPVGQTKAAKKIAESKIAPVPSMPLPHEGMHR